MFIPKEIKDLIKKVVEDFKRVFRKYLQQKGFIQTYFA